MNLLVIDSSVAVKWIFPAGETLVDQAVDLLERYAAGEVRFVVPDLFWAELANILWKAVRTGRVTRKTAEAGLAATISRGLPTVSSLQLAGRALTIATTFDRTAYDSLYIALAEDSSGLLVTADEKLANAVGARLPVMWLGAL